MATLISDRKVKTRKPHQCWGCLKNIESRSTVRVVVSKGDAISRVYYCSSCCAAFFAIQKRDPRYFEDGVGRGDVARWIMQNVCSCDEKFKAKIDLVLTCKEPQHHGEIVELTRNP